MIRALLKSIAQLGDPRLRRVLRLGILGALASYILLLVAVWIALHRIQFFQDYWADLGTDLIIGVVSLVVPLFFFPAVTTALVSLALDSVADAVEDRHYPGLPRPRLQNWREIIGGSLRFLGISLAVNLLALPVYVLLMFTGLTVIAATVINGYLLGREFFEIAALRRLPPADARTMWRSHLGMLWLNGCVIAFLFSVPIINLTAPILATAMMIHHFHSLRQNFDAL